MAAFNVKPIAGNPTEIFGVSVMYTKDALRLFALEKQLAQPLGYTSVFFDYYSEHLRRVNGKIRVIADRFNDIGRVLEAYASDFKKLKARSDEAAVRVQKLSRFLNELNDRVARISASYPPVPLEKSDPQLARDVRQARIKLDAALDDLREITQQFARLAEEYSRSWAFQPFDGSSGLRDPKNEAQLEKYINAATRYEKYWRTISQNKAVTVIGFLPYVGTAASVYNLAGLGNIRAALEARLRAGDDSARLQLAEINRKIVEATVATALGLFAGKGVAEYAESRFAGELYDTAVALLGANLADKIRDFQDRTAQLKQDAFFIPTDRADRNTVVNNAMGVVYAMENRAYGQAMSDLNQPRRDDNDSRTSTVSLHREDGVLKLYWVA